MSGGHFEYNQYRLEDMADTIERDIEKWDRSEKAKNYATLLRYKLYRLTTLLKSYDYMMSGDSSEETFIEDFERDMV